MTTPSNGDPVTIDYVLKRGDGQEIGNTSEVGPQTVQLGAGQIFPAIEEALCPGGILLYETFTLAERESGRGPRRKEFFLEPDELPALFPKLHVISYREGPDDGTPPTFTARLLARKPD